MDADGQVHLAGRGEDGAEFAAPVGGVGTHQQQYLNEARIFGLAADLRGGGRRIVDVDDDRAAPARVGVQPGIGGPVVDRRGQGIGEVDVGHRRQEVEGVEYGVVHSPGIEQLAAAEFRVAPRFLPPGGQASRRAANSKPFG